MSDVLRNPSISKRTRQVLAQLHDDLVHDRDVDLPHALEALRDVIQRWDSASASEWVPDHPGWSVKV